MTAGCGRVTGKPSFAGRGRGNVLFAGNPPETPLTPSRNGFLTGQGMRRFEVTAIPVLQALRLSDWDGRCGMTSRSSTNLALAGPLADQPERAHWAHGLHQLRSNLASSERESEPGLCQARFSGGHDAGGRIQCGFETAPRRNVVYRCSGAYYGFICFRQTVCRAREDSMLCDTVPIRGIGGDVGARFKFGSA